MSKRRVLLVDDEIDFARMVKLNLELTGHYEVRIETKSTRAYDTAKIFLPDIILLDVIMPGLEGPDVVSFLKRDTALRAIPVIFLTATVTPDEVAAEDGLIGGHAFLAKPGKVSQLINCIESQLAAA